MAGNTFGTVFRLTTFGESHGPALGGVIDGCPPGLALDQEQIQAELDKRRPGQGGIAVTARTEPDQVRLLSGLFEGRTTGTSIGFVIENTDQRSRDYSAIKDIFRPGHGDQSYHAKYGLRDYRGGGRSSGRETASRVVGGAVAGLFLRTVGIAVQAGTIELGGIGVPQKDLAHADARPFFAAHADAPALWEKRIAEVAGAGDSLGGVVEIQAHGVPAGLGEPVFDKLDARLAAAVMSVGAVKGVEIGAGFASARMLGSEHNDPMTSTGFASNNAGGILAGISSGQTICLRVAVKPIPSIAQTQNTVDTKGNERQIAIAGRHDICAIPRIVPVLAAMTRLVLADAVLLQRRMHGTP
ncbi:chorismate synthase [Desulfovibrionales bacterium]